MIKSNSFSRLKYYQDCPLAAKFRYVDKLEVLARPVSDKITEHANDRGSRIHLAAEHFINDQTSDLVPELMSFKNEFAELRILKRADPDLIQTEELWTCDENWTPTNSRYDIEPYLRVIIDIFVFKDKERTKARIIDIKTGKIFGNEVKHAAQLQLYAVTAFTRFPELEEVSAELWYVDKAKAPKITPITRSQAERFQIYWTNRMKEMCEDTVFKPRPHAHTCKFCEYGAKEHSNKWVNKTGDCQFSVEGPF